jgi:hypothetical protein
MTASAAIATAAKPAGDRHLALRITYLASRTMTAGSRRPGRRRHGTSRRTATGDH